MLEGLFQFLFKYRPLVFEQGDFVLGASRPMRLVILAAAAAAVYALFTYRRAGRAEPRDRLVLAGLRLVALAVILFFLFRPVLVLKAPVPQQKFLGSLLHASRRRPVP